ncbi:MAG: Gfo/Idh/MocA family oxidoreductase [Planctomycetes bacterium]|nr:Gfo/Idh/MocA family oxidoreductase [Planctomycetota bacterium]
MKRKVTFGIIGCGEITVHTAKAIAKSDNCEIGIVQDINEDMAKDLADKYDVPYCLTWEELLSTKCIDAVYVATPHYLHAPAVVQAAAAGKHVLVEKPIATTIADADRMIEACRKADVALSVAFSGRYSEHVAVVKEIIEAGAIGKIIGIDCGSYTYKPESYWTGGWTGRVKTDWRVSKQKSGGGVFLTNLIHTIDMMRYVTGLEVVSVASNYDTFKTNVEVEDYIVTIMRFGNGAIGAARAATIVEGKAPPEALEGDRIIGLGGQIFIAPEAVHVFFSRPYEDYKPGRWHKIRAERTWAGVDSLVTGFSKAVLAGKTPPITGLDGKKALEVCVAAYRSGETGQVVSLPLAE